MLRAQGLFIMYGMWWQICIMGHILLKCSFFPHTYLGNFIYNWFSINLVIQLRQTLSPFEYLVGRSIPIQIKKWIKYHTERWEGQRKSLENGAVVPELGRNRYKPIVAVAAEWRWAFRGWMGRSLLCLFSGNSYTDSFLWKFSGLS